ncbi:hypothetical protein [Micromonospora tulbaghiae]|uniref:hypothetical protein n=1 Tax=Micromonospora tulbaghiae TaxID=479978 RepID=UPI0033D57A4C
MTPGVVVHNPDQVMAWQKHDLDGLIGKHVAVRVASDPAYWSRPHDYPGPWQHLPAGVVAATVFDERGPYMTVTYIDGTGAAWIAGQPVYVTATDPKEQ